MPGPPRLRTRRDVLRFLAACGLPTPTFGAPAAWPGSPHQHPPADPSTALVFPRDFGAHPDFRTEWWYLTGWLADADGSDFGFQVTFFRVRTSHPPDNPSRFAPTQLLIAHAALMVPALGTPLHGERAGRFGAPGIGFSTADTAVAIGDWSLARDPADRYLTRVGDDGFSLDLRLTPESRTPWLQGEAGYSRKGPQSGQASHYYSRPQIAVEGTVRAGPVGTRAIRTTGIAWFDHEWSTTVLDPDASGWDWTGINLDDGSALVAFRIRRKGSGDDAAPLWDYAARRLPDGRTETLGPLHFTVLRTWRSPRTGARYPVAMRIGWPGRELELVPLFDDQELDSRASTGTVYWEGAVTVTEAGRRVGLGYLELTGYLSPMRL